VASTRETVSTVCDSLAVAIRAMTMAAMRHTPLKAAPATTSAGPRSVTIAARFTLTTKPRLAAPAATTNDDSCGRLTALAPMTARPVRPPTLTASTREVTDRVLRSASTAWPTTTTTATTA
jgi:hypothetical protein